MVERVFDVKIFLAVCQAPGIIPPSEFRAGRSINRKKLHVGLLQTTLDPELCPTSFSLGVGYPSEPLGTSTIDMTESLFTEDAVTLKDDPSVTGIVLTTWRDVDSGSSSQPENPVPHDGLTKSEVAYFLREGQAPPGYVIIKFAYPDYGSTLIRESALILKDRAITAGDVVKRKSSDAGSGMVIKTSMTCFLQPIYNDLPYHGSESWSHLPQNNRILVPGEDLDTLDYEVGDRIIYRDWMGEIADIFQEVSVRLSNGTVVKVQDPALLEVPNYVFKPVNPSNELPIADALSMGRSRRNAITSVKPNEKGNTSPPSYLYPGQTVLTTKANLRLGRWVIGSYTASEPPRGIVVNINVTSVRVDWIATKPSNIGRPDFSKPDEIIDFPDIEEIRLYDRHNLTSATDSTSNSFGSRHGHNFSAGDVVKFRDIAGAAVKYSEHSPARAVQGVFRRIPRMITQGFDMNTFQIIETNTCAFIQWQDGSVTKENSNDVIPYVNVDDHDVWVGEIVSLKNAEEKRDGFIYLKEVGVVQSVDALERIAKVRWFEEPEAVVVDGIESELFPSTLLGPISDRESSVALFDIMAYPALTRRRGDLVVLRPASVALQGRLALERALALHHANLSDTPASADMFPSMAASRPSLASYPLADFPNSFFAPRNEDSQNILSNSEVRWFGEVVDLGLDGLLAVRLGGLDKPEDIRVPVERVTVVLGGEFDSESDDSYDSSDDYSGMSEDESYISDDDSWLYRLQEGFDGFDGSPMAGPFTSHDEFAGRLVREHLETEGDQQTDLEVEYEGGERLDSGLEEDWMTDDTEDSEDEDEKSNNKKTNTKSKADKDVEMQDAPLESESSSSSAEQNGNISHPRPIVHTSKPGNPSALSDPPKQSTPNRSSIPNDKPLQFEILESSEHRNHHFTSSAPTLSAQFLRRVRKEHSMLENCLPEGIWIRTWEERLDLLRVLILGPRGTPYELAPFLFDFKLPFDFPTSPPQVYFHSWTNNIGRINPNLYEDGKVCLSILGTWDSSSTIEGWSPSKSSMLQVLVSILGLVLVEEPYYNEAGFETLVGSEDTLVPARIYREKALCMSKGFVAHALSHDIDAMDGILDWLYTSKAGPHLLREIMSSVQEILFRRRVMEENGGKCEKGKEPISAGAEILLNRYLPILMGRSAEIEE